VIAFRRLPQGLSAALGGLAASQFPAFFDQYLQSLGGRLDQARVHAQRIAETARDQGLSLEAYLRRFADNADPVVQSQAEVMASALADEARLSTAFATLSQAPAGFRPLVLLRHLDADIAAATAERFMPAAPLGLEGLVYAGIGALLGLAALAGGRRLAQQARHRLAHRQDRRHSQGPEHAG
jgi:phage tail tape-measure protein